MKKRFDLISIVIVVLLGPVFVFPKEKWNWILLSVSIIWIGQGIIERRFLPKTPIDFAAAPLLIIMFAGVFIIRNTSDSVGKYAGLIYGIILFYGLVEALKTSKRIKIAVLVFLIMGIMLSVAGTLGRYPGDENVFPGIESVLSKIPKINFGIAGAEMGINRNALGGILLLFIPLGLIQFPILLKKQQDYVPRWMRKICIGSVVIILIIQFLAVIISISFGTWLALILALWLMCAKKKRMQIAIGGILLVLISFVYLVPNASGHNTYQGIRNAIKQGLETRIVIWNASLEIAKAHPVIGIGMDQLRRTPKLKYDLSHAHNQFLNTAAELGIPGLISYLIILIEILWMTGEVRRSALPEWIRLTSRGLGTGICAFTLFGLGDAIPLGAKPGIFFWISLAIITSIYLYGRENGLLARTVKCRG